MRSAPRRRPRACPPTSRPCSSTSARLDEFDQGAIPTPCTSRAGFSSRASRPSFPICSTPIVITCQSGSRSAFAAARSRSSATRMSPRSPAASGAGSRTATRGARRACSTRRSGALRPPHAHPRGRRGRPAPLLDSKVLLSAPAASARPPACTWPRRVSARSAIVDADIVDESNLQRQVLHSTARSGCPRPNRRDERIEELNPDVRRRRATRSA